VLLAIVANRALGVAILIVVGLQTMTKRYKLVVRRRGNKVAASSAWTSGAGVGHGLADGHLVGGSESPTRLVVYCQGKFWKILEKFRLDLLNSSVDATVLTLCGSDRQK